MRCLGHERLRRACVLGVAGLALGCTRTIDDPLSGEAMDFEPDRPAIGEPREVAPYTGSDATVLEAQAELRTGFDLHAKVIHRTCGPTGGVCHNTKEYPDLHTPAHFVDAIGAPCNVQATTHEAIYDRCELPGDRLQLEEAAPVEIGYLDYIPGEAEPSEDDPPDAETPGLHLYVADPVTGADNPRVARFIRSFVTEDQRVADLPFFTFDTRWWVLDDGRHIYGQVAPYQASAVDELLAVGIVQGDENRNGTYGAREGEPVALLEPGEPEESYLIARLRGEMQGEPIPGSRMPLANQPLSVPEMLALFCYVEGLPADGEVNLLTPIDYAGCSYSEDPQSLNLLGSGVTWQQRIKNILEFNCGGCHSGSAPRGDLNLLEGEVYARLLEPSSQLPELNLVEPFDPDASYLWLKLNADERIMGDPMPLNPLTGEGRLTDAELADIRTWIEAGAVENE